MASVDAVIKTVLSAKGSQPQPGATLHTETPKPIEMASLVIKHAPLQTTNTTPNPAPGAYRERELQIVPAPNQLSPEIKFFNSGTLSAQ